MVALKLFTDVLKSLSLSPSSPIGVAVSGGCDSLALALMAKQFFNNQIVAITIDHQLRPNSRQEALQVKKIVESIGLEHKLLTISWPNGVPPLTNKIQTECREQRYSLLLNECNDRNLQCLLCGHHADDQIETFFHRLAFSSGYYGLACMLPLVRLHQNPLIPVIRPLLSVRKTELKQFCINNNLHWIEDYSNTDVKYRRNYYRMALRDHPNIKDGVLQIIDRFQAARDKTNRTIYDVIDKIVHINMVSGYVTIKYSMFCKLPPTIAIKLLEILIMFVHNDYKQIKFPFAIYRSYDAIIRNFKTNGDTTIMLGNFSRSYVFHIDKESFGIAKERLMRDLYTYTPIDIGSTILWDRRFKITLDQLDPAFQGIERKKYSFYIRQMTRKDDNFASRGIRKVKNVKLPHRLCRGCLPVIVAEKEGVDQIHWPVVLIPHFKVIDRKYGVKCTCLYQPIRSLKSYLDYIPETDNKN